MHDAAGNRLYAHVQQAGHANDRSYAYGYDALSRLRTADLGVLSSSPPWQIVATPGVPSRSHTWTPDVLGNWTGDANDPNYPGLRIDIDADGDGQSENWITTIHEVNPANQITQIARDDSQVGDWVKQPVYDRAGGLGDERRFVCDRVGDELIARCGVLLDRITTRDFGTIEVYSLRR